MHEIDLPRLPIRNLDAHKGNYGQVLLIGGSRGMTGAVALAGMAAVRSGAGLTRLAVPDVCLDTVASFDPNYMTVPLPSDAQGRISRAALPQLRELSEQATSIGFGPGLSRSEDLNALVAELYQTFPGPMVVDADGLNALAQQPALHTRTVGPRILTPHVGEFRRLWLGAGQDAKRLETGPWAACAEEFAQQHQVVVVMKGRHTRVTDGQRGFTNSTGNPGMATGGSGDVLTGVIAALLGQLKCPLECAALGVFVHGRAGDLACQAKGQVSMSASDIKDSLPKAFLSLQTAE